MSVRLKVPVFGHKDRDVAPSLRCCWACPGPGDKGGKAYWIVHYWCSPGAYCTATSASSSSIIQLPPALVKIPRYTTNCPTFPLRARLRRHAEHTSLLLRVFLSQIGDDISSRPPLTCINVSKHFVIVKVHHSQKNLRSKEKRKDKPAATSVWVVMLWHVISLFDSKVIENFVS